MENSATQKKIDVLYEKLNGLKPDYTPLNDVISKVKDYLENKIEKLSEENKIIPKRIEEQISKIDRLSNMVSPMTLKQEKEFKLLLKNIEDEPEFKVWLLGDIEEDEDFKKLFN